MSAGPSAKELERLGDRMIPGADRVRFGDWILRADRGVTGRANSCWAGGSTERDFGALIGAVEDWYRRRSLLPTFQVFDGNQPVTSALTDRGYGDRPGALVMTGREVEIVEIVAGQWIVSETMPLGLVGLVGDSDRVIECTRSRGIFRAVTLVVDGVVIGGGVVSVDGDAAGIGMMHTHGSHRRRGVASGVLSRLVSEAQLLGARDLWLQVAEDNHGAIALYEHLGFEVAHSYRYHVEISRPGASHRRASPR